MPLFDFECESCHTIFERYTPSYELKTTNCTCGKIAVKIDKVYASVLDFQGSGFYKTDYK